MLVINSSKLTKLESNNVYLVILIGKLGDYSTFMISLQILLSFLKEIIFRRLRRIHVVTLSRKYAAT